MRQLAKALHEMFVALTAEGFTEAQAMHIIGVAYAANAKSGGADG